MFSIPTLHVPLYFVQLWLQKYLYWLLEHDGLVRRNFEIQGAKQLKSMFAYSCKTGKMPLLYRPTTPSS